MGFFNNGPLSANNRKSAPSATWVVFLAGVCICLAWNAYAGKDLNWDQANYHLYLPHSMLEGRLGQDFFPASLQSYLNPLAYFPFYWMVTAEWHSLAISSLMALFHSLNVLLVYLICKRELQAESAASWRNVSAATVLGLLSPVFWVEVGSSFNDVSLTVFLLAAVYIAMSARAHENTSRGLFWIFVSGLLMGLAVGMKLTVATFAVAGAAFCVTRAIVPSIKKLVGYGAGGTLGLAITGGWWAVQVHKQFGNPIFPLYNSIFKSPFFIDDNVRLVRFVPGTFGDLIRLPFEVMDPVSWVYTETIAPDLRLALITCLMALWVAEALVRKIRDTRSEAYQPDAVGWTVLRTQFTAFVVIAVALWLLTSANGRYGLPLSLLGGIPILCLVRAVMPSRWVSLALAVIIPLHAYHLFAHLAVRWTPEKWTPSWFELSIPQQARETPHLYLSVGNQSNTFLAPFIHPDSSFVNIIGQMSIDMESPAGERVRAMVAKHRGRVRILTGSNDEIRTDPVVRARFIKEINAPLKRFGLAADPAECFVFTSKRAMGEYVDSKGRHPTRDYFVLACAASPIPLDPESERERHEAGRIFDAVAATCPNLFHPRLVAVDWVSSGHVRRYIGSEFDLIVNNEGRVYAYQVRTPVNADFGPRQDWVSGPRPGYPCPTRRRSSAWFDGRLLD